MFEIRVALKYLIPKKSSLSTAFISGLSVLLISLVIWLVLVFLSVMVGIERNWISKLTSLHAPIRISPTEEYYRSYYYQVDALSACSDYRLKTIGEKQEATLSDPYSQEVDPELPSFWPKPDLNAEGQCKDPVKMAVEILSEMQQNKQLSLTFQDYEISSALLRLSLLNPNHPEQRSCLSQMTYLLSLTNENPQFSSLLVLSENLPMTFQDMPALPPSYAYLVHKKVYLPDVHPDQPILLPKNYRDSGVQIGTRGSLHFAAPTAASFQEHQISIKVAGFYDPGLLPTGNKCVIVPFDVTRTIGASSQTFSPDGSPTNGIFVWTTNMDKVAHIQKELIDKFRAAGILDYWKVATFEDFEFSKDLLLQFRSDRTLFLCIACIILIVACSNIVSLLVLLVNDKKKEIAILRSMGASFKSIALIFGFCGSLIGLFSCIIGSTAAVLTLRHLDVLVSLLSKLQGRNAFNPAFFGSSLPNQLSWEALLFVLIATPILSLLAGCIPALKASQVKPAAALRGE